MTGRRAEMTPEQRKALEAWLDDLSDVIDSRGKHLGHTLSQVGRCVYCSCGFRYRGTLPMAET